MRSCPRRRTAFTLLEVVIAAALSTVLLAAMLAAVQQVYRAESVAARRLANLQTANGLLDALTRDLQSTIRPLEPATTTDNSASLAPASTGEFEATSTPGTTDPGVAIRRSLLVGTETSVLVQGEPVERPGTQLADAAAASGAGAFAPASRRVQLIWRASENGTVEQVREAVDDPVAGTLVGIRTEASEIATMAFRYFDGTDWLTAWDGPTLGLPPVAVEATVVVSGPDDAPGDSATLVRVIPIPVARYAQPAGGSSLGGLEMLELGL